MSHTYNYRKTMWVLKYFAADIDIIKAFELVFDYMEKTITWITTMMT